MGALLTPTYCSNIVGIERTFLSLAVVQSRSAGNMKSCEATHKYTESFHRHSDESITFGNVDLLAC